MSGGGRVSAGGWGGVTCPLTPREDAEWEAFGNAIGLSAMVTCYVAIVQLFLPYEFKRQFVLNVGEQKPIEVGGNIAMVEDSCNGCVSWYPSLTKPVPEPTSSSPSVHLDTELGADESSQRWTRHQKTPNFHLWNSESHHQETEISERRGTWYFHVGRGSNVTVEIAEGFDYYPIEVGFATGYIRWDRTFSPKFTTTFQPLNVGSPRTFHFTKDDWGTVEVTVRADPSDEYIATGSLCFSIDHQYALLDGHVPSVNLKDPHIVANGIPRPLVEGGENGSEDKRPQPSLRTWWVTAQTPRDDSLSNVTVTVHCSAFSFLVQLQLIVIEVGIMAQLFKFAMRRYEEELKKVVQKFDDTVGEPSMG